MAKVVKILDAIANTKKIVLNDRQIRLGSMYLCCQNLGMDNRSVRTVGDIQAQYSECDRGCAEATGDYEGNGAEPERKQWEKELRSPKKRAYWISELQKEVPFIFNVV